ncbi:MAG: coniferyl aldehyde dehydrogenase [Burkholderiales bacterium]|nr:coniferyl aldehyde dehydrogenase [Burkholderiales bacterium]
MSNSSAHGLSELDQLSTELEAVLQSQRTAYFARPVPSLNERKADLLKLKTYLLENKDGIVAAIHADYGNRSMHETLLTELVPTLSEIDHAIGHVKKWMKPQRRQVDLRNYLGASNRVIPQPLGVVGCIVPWNFPINLTFVPLVSIFAAGNRAMVKMSENSRHLCQYLIKTMPGYFSKDKLAFFDETGGVGVAFSKLKFDHLLFTGSGNTGRAVMAAAAQNLCPVTLELGGKSPAIVCADFPLRKAAERLMFVKCLNAGQICTTVDYLFLPKGKTPEFIELAKEIVQKRYPSIDSVDLTSIIDERSFNRLTQALMQAQAQGATLIQLIPGKPWDAVTRKIAPHIVLHAPENSDLWQREIFGPILPILEYQQIEETVQYINQRARPLAVYPFSNDSRVIEVFLERVMSGGVSVNDALFHVGQTDLPFGGVGESGMGHYHGQEGFNTFSKLRPVFYQASFSAVKFLWPPYGKFATKYLDFLTK